MDFQEVPQSEDAYSDSEVRDVGSTERGFPVSPDDLASILPAKRPQWISEPVC